MSRMRFRNEIISGDGDFVSAIQKVQKLGKMVENAYLKISGSDYLRQVCNVSINFDGHVHDCLREKK